MFDEYSTFLKAHQWGISVICKLTRLNVPWCIDYRIDCSSGNYSTGNVFCAWSCRVKQPNRIFNFSLLNYLNCVCIFYKFLVLLFVDMFFHVVTRINVCRWRKTVTIVLGQWSEQSIHVRICLLTKSRIGYLNPIREIHWKGKSKI